MKKYICCCVDLRIAVRIISFIGLAISIILLTILLNDKVNRNFSISRTISLALGLDWKHFHSQINTAVHADPDGKLISIIIIFYASVFLITNMLLLYSSITFQRSCTIPWLICEVLGCTSKLGALIYHFLSASDHLSKVFITGSIIYIVVMFWFLIVVFTSQQSWKNFKEIEIDCNESCSTPESYRSHNVFSAIQFDGIRKASDSVLDSPVPYRPNSTYDVI